MLVLSMNSKRQRRPSVRLGEIGDISAAFACGFSQKSRENFGHKRYRKDFMSHDEIENNPINGFSNHIDSEIVMLDSGSVDILQNRENKNPNSSKSDFDVVGMDEIDMNRSELNFGNITRKCRVMKRRSRSTRDGPDAFCSAWSSRLSPKLSNEEQQNCGLKEFVGFASEVCNDYYHDTGFKDSSDYETPATSKEACDYVLDEPIYVGREGKFGDSAQEDACYEGNDVSPIYGHVWDAKKFGVDDALPVKRWLEEQGFGKYAGLFEIHEVDEEALPLLTLEDLKEIGLFAVGTRRKLYNAIQRLRRGDISA